MTRVENTPRLFTYTPVCSYGGFTRSLRNVIMTAKLFRSEEASDKPTQSANSRLHQGASGPVSLLQPINYPPFQS